MFLLFFVVGKDWDLRDVFFFVLGGGGVLVVAPHFLKTCLMSPSAQLYRDYFGQYEDPYKFRTIKGWNIRVLTFN